MRSAEDMAAVRNLLAEGLTDCAIARHTGVPRTTVRDWRVGRAQAFAPREHHSCARCGHPEHDPALLPISDYAYLLGMYLGDGCISSGPRGVAHLRIALDTSYPKIVQSCADSVAAVMPRSRVHLIWVRGGGCVNVSAHSKAWPCLFPQHGAGPKHRRPIRLARWQQEQAIATNQPRALLQGLIHSDGSRAMNRVKRAGIWYAFLRYQFTNYSEDIRRIFCDACDVLGVHWTLASGHNVCVARRADVAFLDTFIGPKA